jgi:UDP-glucose 4-epimerase
MKILITGGAGFIGSNIADSYLRAGHEVVIVDDLSTGKRENVPDRAKFYELSILSPEINDILAAEKPNVLSHHAAQIDVRKSVADPAADAETNIVGSLRLIESCRKQGIQKIIFASTGGAIYGEQDFFPADETHPTRPLSPYGIAKFAIEKYLYFYQQSYNIPYVALRYANVYGPRQNAHGEAGVVAIFTDKLLNAEAPTIYGDGSQTRDYVFVGDVVACSLEALSPEVTGIFNVGTGAETDVNALANQLLQIVGVDVPIKYAPAKPGEQMRSCIKPGALQKLPPTHFSQGLKKTVEWFRAG